MILREDLENAIGDLTSFNFDINAPAEELTFNQRNLLSGALGEYVFIREQRKRNKDVVVKNDWFNSYFDVTVDDCNCEIKTEVLYYAANGFTLKLNQYEKCQTVDRLIFIRVPIQREPLTTIYEMKKEAGQRSLEKTHLPKANRECLFIPLKDLKVIGTVPNDIIIKRLYDISNSNYKKGFVSSG